ncbi:Cytokinin hydroxylase [Rhizoctonia solani AG-1 IB]|uniref:Cytokinin hydroxylase n=1 Tax=Thanatephorus cucumeris (strain AG1-IB / isolate 7/3/14) TaxID=1108050 RepID=M5CAP2_THACB|nr:Cytokinin hydroxylase [Rhizoctonia solani AG-1 IB]
MWGDEALLFDFENSLATHDELLDRYGPVCRIKGALGEDRLWIADPRAMNDIILKGFDYFHEPEGFVAWIKLAFGPNIITTHGHKHKIQRKYSLVPICVDTPVFHAITRYLEDAVASNVRANRCNTGIVDIHTWMSNVALEMIGQAGVGYSFGVMEGKEPEYLDVSRQATEIYNQKKQALANGTLESEIAAGNDIISMLLKQNEIVSPEEQMTEQEILSQVNGALARTLHLLAQYPNVQDRLRAEVREAHALYGKDLEYDQLNSLIYLDAVCRESLRLWSPAQLIERVAMKDWVLPLQYPIKSKDGKKTITNLHVPKGAHMYLSVGSVNRDKQTWGEDAEQFNPDRWLQPLPSSVAQSRIPGVYSNLMTFSGGPRSCIGFKFSQLEMKVVLSALIASFKFELGPEEHLWSAAGIVKPYVRHKDGTIDPAPSLRMKVTLVDE